MAFDFQQSDILTRVDLDAAVHAPLRLETPNYV